MVNGGKRWKRSSGKTEEGAVKGETAQKRERNLIRRLAGSGES